MVAGEDQSVVSFSIYTASQLPLISGQCFPFQNELQKSLNQFEKLWNCRWLRNVSVILFFIELGMFKEKLELGVKLENHFPDFLSYIPPANGNQNYQSKVSIAS